jgi:hypothetical protein
MAGRGKKENNIPNEAYHQQVGTQIAHKHFSLGFPRPESKPSADSGNWTTGKSAYLSRRVLCMFFPTRVLAAFLGVRRKSGLRADDEGLFPPRTCKN